MSQAVAAPPLQPAGAASSLPGYYTAYWAQHQQQPPPQPAAAGSAVPYPYAATQLAYAHYPSAGPSGYPTAAAPPAASTASSPAASGTADAQTSAAAVYAKYQEDYARWYNQHYAPYAAYMAQHALPGAAYLQPPSPAAAAGATASAYQQQHAAQATQPPPALQPAPQSAAGLTPYSYSHPHASSHAQQPPQHPPTLQQPSASTAHSATSAPYVPPPSVAAAKRSRWGVSDDSEPLHQQPLTHPTAPPAHFATAASSAPPTSSSSLQWPPSVIEYVKRSLSHCPAGQRVEVETWMRERLQLAVNNGSMHTTNWDREPLAHVRKLADEFSKRYNGASATKAQHAPPSFQHGAVEQRNVEEERREWEERRRREEEGEANSNGRPHFNHDRRFPPRDLKKRPREDEHKSFARDQSSSDDDDDIQHYFTSAYNNKHLSKREQRKQKKAAKQLGKANSKGGIWQVDHVDEERNQGRANRFAEYVQQAASTPMRTQIRTDLFTFSAPSSSSAFGGGDDEDGEMDWSALKIVGTSTSLEKSYFRLTSPPSPSVVRPPPILSAALKRLLSLHASGERNYAYLCDQMKAIRQDLTVQGVQGKVTVRAYEEHARMAIEVGDMSEYNQCQSQLMVLYAEMPEGTNADPGEKENDSSGVWENETEFVMYRLCYYLLVNNQPATASYLRSLTPYQRTLPAIQHALQLRSALACDDFHAFLTRYAATPYMGPILLQHLCPRMRWLGVQVLVRGYKPTKVEIDVFTRALAFSEAADCMEFLVNCGAAISDDRQFVLTADCELHEPVEEGVEDETDKHNVTHALLSNVRRKQ